MVKFGKCVRCGDKRMCGVMFAPVEPVTGKEYGDTFINEKTGNLNHPWPENGSWVNVCPECIPKCIGLKMRRVYKEWVRKPTKKHIVSKGISAELKRYKK